MSKHKSSATGVLALLLSCVLLGSLTSCGGIKLVTATSKTAIAATTRSGATTKSATTAAKATTTTGTTKGATTTGTAKATTTVSSTKATTTMPANDPFAKMDRVLKDLGINFERKWMYADAIGAKEGQKYSTAKGTYELYLYDINSDAYKAAVKNNAMDLSGTLFPATIKNGFALFFYDNVPAKTRSDIIDAFFQ